ncbi:MAG: hypothetical protein HQL30_07400 [Candidatus Omnitrophica bacterium]|nr:hypothetical protein [Candidatus Omnitrophota bacterium]
MKKSLTSFSRKELDAIHALSEKANGGPGGKHLEKLLLMAEEHILEIKELFAKGDLHAVIETGDLAVLCFEIIKGSGASGDEVLGECYARFRRKLGAKLKNTN